jgi:cytochrome b561
MMQLKNSSENYGLVAKVFHWLIALAIITMLCVGFYMADMEKSDLKFQIYGMHKASGVTVLFLVTLRFLWKVVNVQPEFYLTKLENMLSKANFVLLYFMMFAMPVSGICMSLIGGKDINVFGLFTLSAISNPNKSLSTIFLEMHGIFANILVVCLFLHIAASLYHHFIKKDDLLRKIM